MQYKSIVLNQNQNRITIKRSVLRLWFSLLPTFVSNEANALDLSIGNEIITKPSTFLASCNEVLLAVLLRFFSFTLLAVALEEVTEEWS